VVVAIVAVVVAQDVSSAQGETASQMRGVRAVDPMPAEPTGRRFYVVVGIDNYKSWPRLHTAVSDAKGVAKVLEERYGFSAVAPPLFDGRATRLQIESLFNDVLPHKLREDDQLILFFAGHGTTRVDQVGDKQVESGFVVPVDSPADHEKAWSSYISLKGLLDAVSVLHARHVLIVLDSCHSGFAVGSSMSTFRGSDRYEAVLSSRVSRRIITSARRDQLASDNGPIEGHSLFTGTLIEGLDSGRADMDGDGLITSSEIGLYLQQAVGRSTNSRQVPDFGSFQLDDRGEMVLSIKNAPREKQSSEAPSASSSDDSEQPRSGDVSGAKRSRELGRNLLTEKKYSDAIDKLSESYQKVPNAQAAHETAIAYQDKATLEARSKDSSKSGSDFAEAYNWAERYIAFKLPTDERARAAALRDELTGHVAILDVSSKPEPSDIFLDGEDLTLLGRAPLRRAVAPGSHLVIAKRQGFHDAQTRITAILGQTVATDLTLKPIEGQLLVSSEPRGAHVVVESTGEELGGTPIDRPWPVGKVQLIVSADGYVDMTRELTIREDKPAVFDAKLQQAAQTVATLSVTGQPLRASVRIGATSYGEIPTSLSALKPGKTRLEISAAGHDPWTGEVPLEAGAATRVSVALTPTVKPAWRGWKWIGYVGGGTLLLTGAAVGLAAKSANDQYWADPSRSNLDRVRTLNPTADVLMSVGASAILATALVRWLWPAAATSRADVTIAR